MRQTLFVAVGLTFLALSPSAAGAFGTPVELEATPVDAPAAEGGMAVVEAPVPAPTVAAPESPTDPAASVPDATPAPSAEGDGATAPERTEPAATPAPAPVSGFEAEAPTTQAELTTEADPTADPPTNAGPSTKADPKTKADSKTSAGPNTKAHPKKADPKARNHGNTADPGSGPDAEPPAGVSRSDDADQPATGDSGTDPATGPAPTGDGTADPAEAPEAATRADGPLDEVGTAPGTTVLLLPPGTGGLFVEVVTIPGTTPPAMPPDLAGPLSPAGTTPVLFYAPVSIATPPPYMTASTGGMPPFGPASVLRLLVRWTDGRFAVAAAGSLAPGLDAPLVWHDSSSTEQAGKPHADLPPVTRARRARSGPGPARPVAPPERTPVTSSAAGSGGAAPVAPLWALFAGFTTWAVLELRRHRVRLLVPNAPGVPSLRDRPG